MSTNTKPSCLSYKNVRLVKRQINYDTVNYIAIDIEAPRFWKFFCERNYYLKVGAIVQLIRFNVNDVFQTCTQKGYYICMNKNGYVLQVVLVCNYENIPGNKWSHLKQGMINDVIPGYHLIGETETVMNGLRIYCSESENRPTKYTPRTCQRDIGLDWKIPETDDENQKVYGLGFERMSFNDCKTELNRIRDITDSKSYIGIYVPKNTSLVMMDTTKSPDSSDEEETHILTLFQDGSLVILEDIELEFNFFNYYRIDRKSVIKQFSFDDLELGDIHSLKSSDKSKLIYILKPVLKPLIDPYFGKAEPVFASWGLRISHTMNETKDRKIAVLQIPQDSYIERVYEWETGMEQIIQKMTANPWDKYICLKRDVNRKRFILNEFYVPYPGYKENDNYDKWLLSSAHQNTASIRYIPSDSTSKANSDETEPKVESSSKPTARHVSPTKPNECEFHDFVNGKDGSDGYIYLCKKCKNLGENSDNHGLYYTLNTTSNTLEAFPKTNEIGNDSLQHNTRYNRFENQILIECNHNILFYDSVPAGHYLAKKIERKRIVIFELKVKKLKNRDSWNQNMHKIVGDLVKLYEDDLRFLIKKLRQTAPQIQSYPSVESGIKPKVVSTTKSIETHSEPKTTFDCDIESVLTSGGFKYICRKCKKNGENIHGFYKLNKTSKTLEKFEETIPETKEK